MSDERLRLVVLGGSGVGKSSILKRFICKTYTDRYKATVEDLYTREYALGDQTLKVSIQHDYITCLTFFHSFNVVNNIVLPWQPIYLISSTQVDILDTSGDMEFPAMRRLSIANANGFILVYAATSASSFTCVKQCFEEIREQRNDYQVRFFLLTFEIYIWFYLR